MQRVNCACLISNNIYRTFDRRTHLANLSLHEYTIRANCTYLFYDIFFFVFVFNLVVLCGARNIAVIKNRKSVMFQILPFACFTHMCVCANG